MGILDDFGDKLSKVSRTVSQKTKEFADSAKLETQVLSEQKSLDNLYKELGKKCYAVMQGLSSAPVDDAAIPASQDMFTVSSEITAAEQHISMLKEQIELQKSSIICTGCGEKIPGSSEFCPKCGAKVK